MTNKWQELSVSVLEHEDCESELDPSIKLRLAKLIRAKTSRDLIENLSDNPVLEKFRCHYICLPEEIRSRCNWDDALKRFLENGGRKLFLAMSMQGDGSLCGIDINGKVLIRDIPIEPVMYGYDSNGNLLEIYDRGFQIHHVVKWADYFAVRKKVKEDGYELFPYSNHSEFSEEMKQAEDKRSYKPFVGSSKQGRERRRISYLECGDDPGSKIAVAVNWDQEGVIRKHSRIDFINSTSSDSFQGVVRLLRV